MSVLHLAYIIALKRTIARPHMELVLFLGVLLAVALMASGVVFSDLLEEVALRKALAQAAPEEVNISVRVYNGLDDPTVTDRDVSLYQAALDTMQRAAETPLAPYLRERALLVETRSFLFTGHPQMEMDDDVRPRGGIKYMDGLAPDRVEVVAGIWPYSDGEERLSINKPLEVAMETTGAELLQLGLGDEWEVFPAVGGEGMEPMTVRVVALFSRLDLAGEFWYGTERTFSHLEGQLAIVPLFTTEDAILQLVGRGFPGAYTQVTWFYYPDVASIRANDVGTLQRILDRMEREVRGTVQNSSTTMKLDTLLADYRDHILIARIPLFLMVSLTTAILVYYLALASGLMVKSRSAEIALLKSRGATTGQIGVLALVEGLLMAVPAIGLGPLLALGFARTLGEAFVQLETGGGHIPVALSPQAFLLGGMGAVLAVVVLAVSTLVAARQGIVSFLRSGARPPQASFIHRYYLDILALAVIGLVWWQVQARGSFLVRSLDTGELQVDISLLLSPVLGLVALGLLVMRIFPLAMAVLARVSESVGPVWLVEGLRRVSRDPVVPGALLVLLTLTTALGFIGSTFVSTLERSQRDRAMYVAGADLLLEHTGGSVPISPLGLSAAATAVEGVESAAEVGRLSGALVTRGLSATDITILAVDTRSFADAAWYRRDLGDGKALGALMEAISPEPDDPSVGDGLPLPQDATGLALWVQPGSVEPRSSLIARLRDATGLYFDVLLGALDYRGWQRLEGELTPIRPTGRPQPPPIVLTPPHTLVAIQVASAARLRSPGVVFLDELMAVTPGGETHLQSLQDLDEWQVVVDYSAPGLFALEPSQAAARSGSGIAAALSWIPGGSGLPSIRPGGPEAPMAALMSSALLEKAGAGVGDSLTIGAVTVSLPFSAAADVRYFPTLDPREQPFLVVDLATLSRYMNLHGQVLTGTSSELWVKLHDGTRDPAPLVAEVERHGVGVTHVQRAADLVSERVEQPLVSAGWSGLLVLMFLALVLASVSGVMLFSYTDTQQRRTEFALLRTLGFSRRQLNGVVWFNILLVMLSGIALGTWAGSQIGLSLLPILEVAEEGVRVTPPMVLQVNWTTLAASYAVSVAVAGGTVAWLTWVTARLEIQRALRIGEA